MFIQKIIICHRLAFWEFKAKSRLKYKQCVRSSLTVRTASKAVTCVAYACSPPLVKVNLQECCVMTDRCDYNAFVTFCLRLSVDRIVIFRDNRKAGRILSLLTPYIEVIIQALDWLHQQYSMGPFHASFINRLSGIIVVSDSRYFIEDIFNSTINEQSFAILSV